jgi:hypothetical protein
MGPSSPHAVTPVSSTSTTKAMPSPGEDTAPDDTRAYRWPIAVRLPDPKVEPATTLIETIDPVERKRQ